MSASKAPQTQLPPLQDRVTFLTHRINARLQQVSHPVISQFGLDLYSSRVLFALSQNGPMKVGQLAELMALPQSTISHQVKRMEKNGLVRRERSEEDNRTVYVSTTEHGAKATEVCKRLSDIIHERIADGFEDEALAQLTTSLKTVFDLLEDIPALEKLAGEYSDIAAE